MSTSTTAKTTIFDFAGNPKKSYSINYEKVLVEGDKSKTQVGHLIIVIDRSGSMYYDINALKDTVIKNLTIGEYENSTMVVTVISYSGVGDITVHFERTSVSEVMAADSPYVKSIRKIKATYLTCISQAMEAAEKLIDDDEVTGIVLHSDGYANDPSQFSENRSLDAVCKRLSERNVFVNTIAYSDYSDFVLLSKVASSVSGMCVKATNSTEVYNAIKEASETLASGSCSILEVPSKGADITVFVSNEPRKVVGAKGDLSVKGVGDDGGVVFRFKEIPGDDIPVPTGRHSNNLSEFALVALSKALLGMGDVNGAKYAMASSMNKTLTSENARALTPNQIADMSAALDEHLFVHGGKNAEYYSKPGIDSTGPSILELVDVLERHKGGFLVNVTEVRKGYRRRGLKKLAGKRLEDGSIEEPVVDTVIANDTDYARVGSFDVNRDSATINMTVPRKVKLIDRKSKKEIPEVAGVLLDNLQDYKRYTIVGDGEVCLQAIPIKFSSKDAFDSVKDLGLVSGSFDPSVEHVIDLGKMTVCPYGFEAGIDIVESYEKIAKLNIVGRILTGLSKGKSSTLTTEQVAELKKYCLSENLYINMATTVPYKSLEDAIADGSVDVRTGYKVVIGNKKMLGVGSFKSANAFVDRAYTVTDSDKNKVAKPQIEVFFQDVKVEDKVLSSRTKWTDADVLQKSIYDQFFGISALTDVADMAEEAGVPELSAMISSPDDYSADEAATVIEEAQKALKKLETETWADVTPLVFYIGSTGLVPDEFETTGLTADDFMKECPDISLTKAEKEGTFFIVGDAVIAVYAKQEYYSADRKTVKTGA